MLDLDSAKWFELRHAYGSAGDTPDLLRRAAVSRVGKHEADEEIWQALWSSLCHQQDVYNASYAAVPHLVAYASLRPLTERWIFIGLVSQIEICRHHDDADPMPDELKTDYFEALGKMRPLILDCLKTKLEDIQTAKTFLSALVVVDGLSDFGWDIATM